MEPKTQKTNPFRIAIVLLCIGLGTMGVFALGGLYKAGTAGLQSQVDGLSKQVVQMRAELREVLRRVAAMPGDIIHARGIGYFEITDPRDLVQRLLIEGIPYEPEMLELIRTHLKPGDVAVDVGSYIGTHAIVMAQEVGDAGRVFAFDPSAEAVAQLKRNLVLNKIDNVTITSKALGDTATAGFIRVFDEANQGANRACTATDIESGAFGCDRKVEQDRPFEMVRFDDLGITGVALMKIDVEGHELGVLKGARESLLRDKPVLLMEVWDDHPAMQRPSKKADVFAYVEGLGYKVEQVETYNYIALPRDVK